ncbi:MAG: hypothetical protein IJ468_09880 [Lachnospiraceae bacterium]|nr:hypothetical protein [Lachnospiraceae bacterium]
MEQLTILHTPEELALARQHCWDEYITDMNNNVEELAQFSSRLLLYGTVHMRFYLEKKGNPGPDGYPVYIALHGGGQCPVPDMNDRQWLHQHTYYFDSVTDGICIAPRGIRDTWNTHFNEESFPLYDRLIMDLAAYENVDLNRVYLMGFSAGGDGVYGITPLMTDRFAAANMSAGHPNYVDLTNLYNLPLELQVGEEDGAYSRNRITANYGIYLDRLKRKFGDGFEHRVLIHHKKPHNFSDNERNRVPQTVLADYRKWLYDKDETTFETNTNAVDYVSRFTRNPLPRRVVWNLARRAGFRNVKSNYWLWAEHSASVGSVIASYDRSDNSITIEELTSSGVVKVLLNEDMLDVFSPITVRYPDHTEVVTVQPNLELLRSTTAERGDRNYQFCASITLNY